MGLIARISGVPLFSTTTEALRWGKSNNLQGYHSHVVNGQLGYMGGRNHNSARYSSVTKKLSSANNQVNTSIPVALRQQTIDQPVRTSTIEERTITNNTNRVFSSNNNNRY